MNHLISLGGKVVAVGAPEVAKPLSQKSRQKMATTVTLLRLNGSRLYGVAGKRTNLPALLVSKSFPFTINSVTIRGRITGQRLTRTLGRNPIPMEKRPKLKKWVELQLKETMESYYGTKN